MDIINYKENCEDLKGKLMQQYNSVTKEDLRCNNGGKEEMLKKLRHKLGKTDEELFELILKL